MIGSTHDVLVLGHGLAGSALVHHLHERGLKTHVFDAPRTGSASRAAAGLVNPISLRRDIPTWRATEMLTKAQQAYTSFEELHHVRVWHPLQLIKIFPTPAETAQWERAMANGSATPFLASIEQEEISRNSISAPHGHGTVLNCGWLDMRTMLSVQRSWLQANGSLTEAFIGAAEIQDIPGGVKIRDLSAPWLIQCDGPFASAHGIVPVKGEVITVRIPELQLKNIVHRGIFILPIGDQLFRIGSTYKWDDVWDGPSADARDHLLTKLKEVIPFPIEVIEHRAGVRPATRDRRPIIGSVGAGRAIFNGLGSRGVMLAPWCAQHLIANLIDGEPLDPEVDPARFTAS